MNWPVIKRYGHKLVILFSLGAERSEAVRRSLRELFKRFNLYFILYSKNIGGHELCVLKLRKTNLAPCSRLISWQKRLTKIYIYIHILFCFCICGVIVIYNVFMITNLARLENTLMMMIIII